MRSANGGPIWRLRRSHQDAPADPEPTPEPEPTFVCSVCHREMPVAERSRVALGRCRACV